MRVLRTGSTGPAVELLQLALDRAGFGGLETDGFFGQATKNALARFQGAFGLTVDGVAGPETHRAILPWYTGYLVHTVRRGDTLSSIAALHGASLEALTLANPGLQAENLRVGAPGGGAAAFPGGAGEYQLQLGACGLLRAWPGSALSLYRHRRGGKKRHGQAALDNDPGAGGKPGFI